MGYTGVFVFGDSLVDSGNALALAEWYGSLTLSDLPDGAPTAEAGYHEGRFTNGLTFADLVSNKYIGVTSEAVFPYGYEDPWLGVPIAPFADDPSGNNLNFAYGGAQIRQGDEVVPDLDAQTDAFRDAVDGDADPGALYLITIGGNDVRALVPKGSSFVSQQEATAILGRAAAEMKEEIAQLIATGASNVVVTGVPNVGIIPQYDLDGNGVLTGAELARSRQATLYSQQLDAMIQQALSELQAAHPTANIHYVSLTEATEANLARLEALFGRPLDLTADGELLFFDQIHPTAQAHALLAGSILDSLSGAGNNDRLPLTAPDYSKAGTIGVVGETDKVVVSLIAGVTYTFDLRGVSSAPLGTGWAAMMGMLADPTIRIVGPGGRQVGSDDDGGLGLDSAFSFTPGRSGDYAFHLSGVGSATGTYTFQASGNALGDSLYAVQTSSAVILERAGEGNDTVQTSVSYRLAAGVSIESLTASSPHTETNIKLIGNAFEQSIIGNAGNNVIDGRGGDDTLTGGAGADRFAFTT
ncbi:MAG: hypothetical protein H0U34_08315, partial [Sphingomonas sp.]|nr:hypothetical protein [Sphingomonas sp.]